LRAALGKFIRLSRSTEATLSPRAKSRGGNAGEVADDDADGWSAGGGRSAFAGFGPFAVAVRAELELELAAVARVSADRFEGSFSSRRRDKGSAVLVSLSKDLAAVKLRSRKAGDHIHTVAPNMTRIKPAVARRGQNDLMACSQSSQPPSEVPGAAEVAEVSELEGVAGAGLVAAASLGQRWRTSSWSRARAAADRTGSAPAAWRRFSANAFSSGSMFFSGSDGMND
jgi:hypothetical protein